MNRKQTFFFGLKYNDIKILNVLSTSSTQIDNDDIMYKYKEIVPKSSLFNLP